MSDDQGVRLSRRSILAGTAALGLAGSSTALGRQFGDTATRDADTDTGGDAPVDSENGDWPLPDHDNGNTRFNAGASVPTGTLTEAWSESGVDGPPVVADGTLFLLRGDPTGPADGEADPMTLSAVDTKTWTRRWTRDLQPTTSYVLGAADGTVYANARDGDELRAFDATTGTELWSVAESRANLTATADAVLYESPSGVVCRSAEDGSVQWTYESESVASFVVANEAVYVAVADHPMPILSLEDGSTLTRDRHYHRDTTLVATENTLYFHRPGSLTAVERRKRDTGDTLWTHEFDRAITDRYEANELVAKDGTVYLVRGTEGEDNRNTIYAFDADTGDERWRTESENGYYPLVGAANGLYSVTMADRTIVRRDLDTGEVLSEREGPGGFVDHLVVTDDTVYVTDDGGTASSSHVHAYRADSEPGSGGGDESKGGQGDGSEDC
ncbi:MULTISPECIES: PQQ-binding-like beta-propeller repeat protein [Halorussus]|uniref:outer membrane protein assembly factor BamB family protein n=1 Tax=Halorussus TaxID=1070314 RepID=UPI00209F713D|nr:PQQ-binding-like beta-propeller repeat protein [Halorussus vallis]USZ77328.1 PQQ-binding-like beta-propeller repeat protein [Halorussus vallis]